MGHIRTEPGQYDQTVSLYIINVSGDEPRMLLHRHRLLGKLMQPGGHVELDEHHWGAVKHELLEETGYELRQLRVLQPKVGLQDPFAQLLPTPLLCRTNEFWFTPGHFHEDLVYGFITEELPRHAVGEGESAEIRWVTLAELQQLGEDEVIADAVPIGQTLLTGWQQWESVPTESFG